MIKVIKLSDEFDTWLVPQGEKEFDEFQKKVEEKIEKEFPEAELNYSSKSDVTSDQADIFLAKEEEDKCMERIDEIFQDTYESMRKSIE